ncbi:MAG: diadenylate cyclase, partial [Spirochaetota bacterium]
GGYKAFVAAGAQELLYGVFTIGLLYLGALLLRLEFLLWILERIIPTLLLILAVILQPELRRIFVQIGRQSNLFHFHRNSYQDQRAIEEMTRACEILSSKGRGALIVFRRENLLRPIINTGTRMDARPSSALMVSLFAYDTPLHDGAAVLERSRILAAGCILPIDPEETNLLSMQAGTRHRSAMSLARSTDAVVLIVSEESGNISLAFDGLMRSNVSASQANTLLCELLISELHERSKWKRIRPFFHRLFSQRFAARPSPDSPNSPTPEQQDVETHLSGEEPK